MRLSPIPVMLSKYIPMRDGPVVTIDSYTEQSRINKYFHLAAMIRRLIKPVLDSFSPRLQWQALGDQSFQGQQCEILPSGGQLISRSYTGTSAHANVLQAQSVKDLL